MSDEQLKHLTLLAHHAYGSFDLAINCLQHLVARKAVPPDALQNYIGLIGSTIAPHSRPA